MGYHAALLKQQRDFNDVQIKCKLFTQIKHYLMRLVRDLKPNVEMAEARIAIHHPSSVRSHFLKKKTEQTTF